MKNICTNQVINLWFQVDIITPNKIELFEEHSVYPVHAKSFKLLSRGKTIRMVSNGIEITESNVFEMALSPKIFKNKCNLNDYIMNESE